MSRDSSFDSRLTRSASPRGGIRDADYGDREDIVAEEEELRHEMGAMGGGAPDYPPRTMGKGKPRRRVNALSMGLRRHKSKVRIAIMLVVLWPLFLWFVLAVFFPTHPALFPPTLLDSASTLIVVAHPDDECLFFAPSVIAAVQRAGSRGAVLVLSSGNHYGIGELRRQELRGSCEEMGVESERCDVLDMPSVQDDPVKWWPIQDITTAVKEHVDKWAVDVIITFDSGGVSGHINHRAVSAALTSYALSPPPTSTHRIPTVYLSQTVPLLRKYSGLYDLPLSFLSFLPSVMFGSRDGGVGAAGDVLHVIPMEPPYLASTEEETWASERRRFEERGKGERGLLVSGLSGYAARKAFERHASQMSWDRHLYMLVSRYMYFNTIERIV